MATKKPLVITNGRIEQMQSGDRLDIPFSATSVIPLENEESSEALTKCMAVYISSANKAKRALANTPATSKVRGLVKTDSISPDATGDVVTNGILTATIGEWDAIAGTIGGLSPNTAYFLDFTAPGHITATAPTTEGYVTEIGVAISTTELVVEPKTPIKL